MEKSDTCKKYEFITKTNFSIIYKFIDDDNKPYILKVIPNHKIKQELEISRRLPSHKNIIKFIGEKNNFDKNDCMINKEYQFLVFEYYDGISLHKFIKNNKLNSINIKKIIYQIIEAVYQLHKNNIVHNDLKLENILICPKTLNIKIIDFGLSQIGKAHVFDTIFGSIPYLAPEIVSSRYYSVYSDIWALGILFFSLVEGRFPFYSNSKEDIIDEISTFTVKKTVKKIYKTKYSVEENSNFFKNIFIHNEKNKNKSNYKILLEISLMCLKSKPEERPSIEDLLNLNFFQDVFIL